MSAYREASFDELLRVMIGRGITAVPVIDAEPRTDQEKNTHP
jgi:hypothetical protein